MRALRNEGSDDMFQWRSAMAAWVAGVVLAVLPPAKAADPQRAPK